MRNVEEDVKFLECKKVSEKEMKKTKIEKKRGKTRVRLNDVYRFMSKRETREASVVY